MAKRARGSNRPGQRRPTRRTNRPTRGPAAPATPASAPGPSDGLTAAEEARAAELESRVLEEERAAGPGRAADPSLSAAAEGMNGRARARERAGGAGLAAQYAHEYDYVSRDLRRIAILMASLTGVMVMLWILIDQLGVIQV